jgi:hypothetical protein
MNQPISDDRQVGSNSIGSNEKLSSFWVSRYIKLANSFNMVLLNDFDVVCPTSNRRVYYFFFSENL